MEVSEERSARYAGDRRVSVSAPNGGRSPPGAVGDPLDDTPHSWQPGPDRRTGLLRSWPCAVGSHGPQSWTHVDLTRSCRFPLRSYP